METQETVESAGRLSPEEGMAHAMQVSLDFVYSVLFPPKIAPIPAEEPVPVKRFVRREVRRSRTVGRHQQRQLNKREVATV